MVEGDVGGDQCRLQLMILRETAFGVGRGAGGECRVGNGVGIDPMIMMRRAKQHVPQGAGLGIDCPALPRQHRQAAFLASMFCATRTSAI